MNSAACQKEDFPLAGLLSQLGTGNTWNLSKPDMRSLIAGGSIAFTDAKKIASGRAASVAVKVIFLTFTDGVEDFSDITMRGSEGFSDITTRSAEGFSNIATRGGEDFCGVTTREGDEFSEQYARVREADPLESIKKGSMSNATLWGDVQPDKDFCRMQKSILEQNHKVTAPQVNRVTINYSVQPSGASLAFLRWRRLISPCKAETTNCPVVSPSSFNSSIAFATSCGTRAAIVCDFALTDFVAMPELLRNRCSTVWQKEKECKRLTCSTPCPNLVFNTLSTGKAQEAQKITKPAGATNTNGPLTTTDSLNIEAAMKNHTTPLTGRDSLTPNKFTWRFLAISRSDRNAKPCRMSVEAHTEREARRVLAPHFILSFSSRLPVKG